ncbi:helix-turn-helix transcriptional regulator [Nocardia sp. MH4]|uniref:helix-turn-helix domain-containing protein n=1 Tax=Nocardia sp. MH4 TaxID=1768677 RepID=UPI001C4FD514|nr:helix-turn-helix transcriptional regulator [Nocardia sp. MH4]
MTAEDDALTRRIGAIVTRARLRRGLNQAAFARAAEVDVRTVRGLESGDKWPWDANRTKIEQALGFAVGALELWRENPHELAKFEQTLTDRDDTGEDGPTVDVSFPTAKVNTNFHDALGQLRAANIAVAAERLALLPAEDIARVQALIDELGRARFPDWDDQGDYDLAWGRRAKLGPLAPEDEEAVFDSLKDVQ